MDQTSIYQCLLENQHISTLHLSWIEVFKSLKNLCPKFINEMFEIKDISYDLRNSIILFQPKLSNITHGNIFQVLWRTYLELAS